MSTKKVAVIGSGNIGTDLMFKIIRLSESLEVGALVGVDPEMMVPDATGRPYPITHGGSPIRAVMA